MNTNDSKADVKSAFMSAMEYGFRLCEKGYDLETASMIASGLFDVEFSRSHWDSKMGREPKESVNKAEEINGRIDSRLKEIYGDQSHPRGEGEGQ